MPMATATATARPYASISQSPPGDLCLGDDPGEDSFEQFVETTSQKMLDSYVEMKKQAEDDLERISRDIPNPNDPATRKQLEEDRVNRMKNIGMMIIGQWKALVVEEMTLREVAQTSPDIQEFVQRKRIALTESITKLYHGRDDNSTRRDSQGPTTPARNTLPRTGQKVWRPPPQTTTPNATRRGTPSLPSGSSTVQGSPLDRRTSDGSSSKSFQSWVFDLSSPITNRQFHAEPEEISPSDGGSSDPEKSDNEDDAFGSDLESDERPHGRRPSHSNWRMPAPERVRPMPIGNNSNKLWRPSMESIPANAQANNRRVPGSSLERMSTQDPQGSGTQTPSRPTGRGSVDMSNPADKQSWGSIGSDSTSWKARNTWGSLDQPKPPIHHFSRSPVASASPPTQPSDNIQPSPQSFASNAERDVQVLRDPWSNNSNKPWAQSKEVPKFSSSQSVSPITIDGANTRTRASQQQQQDGDNPRFGRNRSDSDTMSIQNQRLWKPSMQAPTISSPPPFQSTSGSRPMDRQPSYGEPVRSPQFTRTGSDSMKNQSIVSSIPRPEISRSRSPNKLERSRTYDEIPLDSPPPRTRPPPVRSSTEANIYSYNIHPPMVYYSPEPSMIAPSPPASSREITSRDYAYPKPIEDSPIQRPSNMPLSRYPTESLPSNESFSSPDSIGSSLSSSIPSDSDISSLYREQKRLTRLDEETEELERRERELEDRQKKFVDASFEYRERKLSSVNTEMTEVEKRERELQDRKRKVEEQERLLKQKEEELAEKNRRLAKEAQEADEKRRRQEEEERKKREEEDAERDRRRQQWEEEERARKEEERLRLEEEKKRKEEERIRAEEDRIRTEEERRRLEELRMRLAEEHTREVERMRKRMEEEHIREMREAAERKAKEDAERKAREEEERRAREEADRLAREEILRIAKEETARRIKEELEAEAKRVKEEMEKKRKEDEERERKERERLDKEREKLEREKERLAKLERERERREREREEKLRREREERERQEREREERERREREERERREREERELREREERERREREERERREKEEQERREKEEQERREKEEHERREKEERERREKEERERREKEERERREREARERREKEERERREKEERERREKEERERREKEERERREKADRERREKEERERDERERREREDRDRQKERERTEREEKARRDRALKEQEEFDRLRVRTNDTSKRNEFEEEFHMTSNDIQRQKEMLEFFAQKKQREERQKAQTQPRPELGAFPFRTSSASAAAAAMPNYTHAGRAGSTSSSSSNWSQRSSASSYAESTWSSSTSRSSASQASQHSSGSTPLRSTPSSSGTTRMPSSENTHKSTGWRGATNDPFHGGSGSYVPPTENEWKRKQEEQARQQQEQFRRESMKAEQEYMSRATFSTGKDSIVRAWTKYESDWTSLKDRTTLRFRIIPWPLLKSISSPDEITANAVGALVLSPHHSPDKKARDRLKEQLLRWHPDRFEGKWLPKVAEEDKEEVKKGVGQVARALNELMNRENNNPFA